MEDSKDTAAVRMTASLPDGRPIASWARDAEGSLVEHELAAKAKAPRVTLDQVDSEVASRHFFTAGQAITALGSFAPMPTCLLTICVLVLRNGFTVTGESACASPENFDAGVGQRLAHEDAKRKVCKLLGYALRDKLHHAPAMSAAVAQLQVAAETCENNAPIHETEGNGTQAVASRSNAQSYRAAIRRLVP